VAAATELPDGPPILAGHSAGGQLALWYAGRAPERVRAVLALAPVADLTVGYRLGLGDGAVGALLGGSPEQVPDRYAATDLDRRQALKLFATLGAAGVAAPALSACSGSSLNSNKPVQDEGPVRIGLVVPQSGVYKTIGDDLTNGFQLYVKLNGGKLGGRQADLVLADEGETAESGKAATDKLLKQDHVGALTGVVSSATMAAIKDTVETAQVPLVGSNASPTTLQGVKYIWRTSF